MAASIGLYLHIPFCRHLCHYCDFAKTANFSDELETRYWTWLRNKLEVSLSMPWLPPDQKIRSVFLGGGTPSIYTREWLPIFESFQARLHDDAEITLEANPDDISMENLRFWSELGINRISLGVQSFQDSGLRFLTRQHSADKARQAIEDSLLHIGNVNVDLIYGWPGQDQTLWQADLEVASTLGASHLSLYNLTFEGSTPFARRLARGKLEPMLDEEQEGLYQLARSFLAEKGYEHQEVSNWAKPGKACRHNWIYWTDESYLGLGLGAHGYLKHPDLSWGLRYHFPDRLMGLLNHSEELCYDDMASFLATMGAVLETDRNADAWLLETVGCGLRSQRGVSIKKIEAQTGRRFQPNAMIQTGILQGQLYWSKTGDLLLAPAEWFRETRWSLELALSFSAQIAT